MRKKLFVYFWTGVDKLIAVIKGRSFRPIFTSSFSTRAEHSKIITCLCMFLCLAAGFSHVIVDFGHVSLIDYTSVEVRIGDGFLCFFHQILR